MGKEQGVSRLAKYIIAIGITALVLFLVWYFSNVVAYILVSAVLAIIGKPVVTLLRKLKIGKRAMPAWLASLFTLLGIWAVLLVFISFFIPLIFSKVRMLSELDIPNLIHSFREPLSRLQEFIEKTFSMDSMSEFSLTDSLTRQFTSLLNLDGINRILSSVVTVVGNTAVALFSISFITFFFLKEDQLFYNMVVALFPSRYQQNISNALDSISNLLMRYFTGIFFESTIMLLLVSCTLMLWGMDSGNAFFLGMVVGVLNVVPYIGPLIGCCIAIFVGILNPLPWASLWGMVLVCGGSVLLAQGIDNFILQPVLYSSTAKAHPLEIFIVILVAGTAAGVLGMLLAIPAYNVIRVLAKEFFNHWSLVRKLTAKI